MTLQDLFPGAQNIVDALPRVWPISLLKDAYAPFGALHLVGLGLLGGAVILLNLRLMGAGLSDERPSELQRTLRPVFITGLLIVLGTGVIIGMLNPDKLYKSSPFFVKIISLVAALIFSFGVTNAVAKSEGKTSLPIVIASCVAFIIWLVSLGLLSSDIIAAPAVFHPITAGYAILLFFGARTRIVGAIAFSVLFGGLFLMFWIVGFNTYEPVYDEISRYVLIAGALVLMVLYAYEIHKGRADAAGPLAKLIALFSILTWVTVAAAGRWIGLAA